MLMLLGKFQFIVQISQKDSSIRCQESIMLERIVMLAPDMMN